MAQFRRAVRRHSLSIYSNSGSEFDRLSQRSGDSYLGEGTQPLGGKSEGEADPLLCPVVRESTANGDLALTGKNSGSLEERMSTGL